MYVFLLSFGYAYSFLKKIYTVNSNKHGWEYINHSHTNPVAVTH